MSAEPPFTAHAFAIELRLPGEGEPLCEAAFCECDGLELQRSIVTLREGGAASSVRLLAGQESFGRVTLRRGMTSDFDLWDWWERVRRDPRLRATCDVIVLSPDLAEQRARFRLHGCLPAKLTAPHLDATGNEVAIETLEIACESIELVRPGEAASTPPAFEPAVRMQLRELDAAFVREINKTRWVTAQINPADLRTTRTHELGPRTELQLRLTFDVRASQSTRRRTPDDVRRLTERVAYFATPRPGRGGETVRPAVRLVWGTFEFDGQVQSLEETIEEFSADGRPLRATVALVLARGEIGPYAFRGA